MEQITPLRRSNRLRRQTSKAMGSSPISSPGTSANAARLIYPRSTLFDGPGDQSDSDSSLQSTTSSKCSGSFTGSTVVVTVPMLPKRLAIDYQVLAPIVDYSDAKLMEHVSVTLLFPTTNPPSHSFPLLTHPPTMCDTGYCRFKHVRHEYKGVHAEHRFVLRALLPMARGKEIRQTLRADCESYRCQESSSATENAVRRGILDGRRRPQVHTGSV